MKPASIQRRNAGTARGARFEAMFRDTQLGSSSFRNFNEFASALHFGQSHPGLMAATGMSEGIGADGGFLVPTEYVARMLNKSLDGEIVRPRARLEPMTTNSKVVAGFDTSNHSTSIGGFVGHWYGEGSPMTPQKGKVTQFNLRTAKLAILAACSNELLSDGADFGQLLEATLSGALGWYMGDAFLNGDGVGKPLGILKDPALVVRAKETSQVAAAITQDRQHVELGRHAGGTNLTEAVRRERCSVVLRGL